MKNLFHHIPTRSFSVSLLFLCSLCSVSASHAQQPTTHLIPVPREAHFAGTTPLSAAIIIVPGNDTEDNSAATDLSETMRERGIHLTPGIGAPAFTITLLRED